VERQLPWSFVGQVGYVGTRAIRHVVRPDINAGWIAGAGVAGQPLYQKFGRTAVTQLWLPFGTLNYNSLQASLDRRLAGSMLVKVAYTFGKVLGYNDNTEGGLMFNMPSQWGRSYAPTAYDRTHNFRAAWSGDLPFGAGKRWANQGSLARGLLGGWQVNGVFSSYTGTPFSVTASNASLNAPNNNQTADQVKTQVEKLGGVGPFSPFYDPLAFAPVTTARFGTSGKNILRGPGLVNVDFSLFRSFRLTERVGLQFRAESLNLTNTPHFNNPGTNVSNRRLNPDGTVQSLGGFMAITSATTTGGASAGAESRTIRFGLRLAF
jgi:hypothetical protein